MYVVCNHLHPLTNYNVLLCYDRMQFGLVVLASEVVSASQPLSSVLTKSEIFDNFCRLRQRLECMLRTAKGG